MKSSETEGSPTSSFATRDWLDLRIFASSTCVSFCYVRNFLKLVLSFNFNSMYEDSSSDKLRNSAVEPIFQPFFSKLFCFCLFIFIILYSFFTHIYNTLRRLLRFLFEYFKNYYCVIINSLNNPPSIPFVIYSQFIAIRTYTRHWSRMWHFQFLSHLKKSKKKSSFYPCSRGKWRSFYFSMQPDERFILYFHGVKICQI